jgi:hypothetical protein
MYLGFITPPRSLSLKSHNPLTFAIQDLGIRLNLKFSLCLLLLGLIKVLGVFFPKPRIAKYRYMQVLFNLNSEISKIPLYLLTLLFYFVPDINIGDI